MNILSIIKRIISYPNFAVSSQNSYSGSTITADLRKAECPACHCNLKKIPGSKTKCPHCLKYIFVRTDPKQNARVLVTQEGADLIDEEWAKLNGTIENFNAQKTEYEQIKSNIIKKGRTPRENDIKWGLCNKHLGVHYINKDWCLYRNVRFDMAMILKRENRFKESLKTFLEIVYIDLNGPNNLGGLSDGSIEQFSPELGDIPDGILGNILTLIRKENFPIDDVKDLFMKQGQLMKRSMNPPLSPDKCWEILVQRLNTP